MDMTETRLARLEAQLVKLTDSHRRIWAAHAKVTAEIAGVELAHQIVIGALLDTHPDLPRFVQSLEKMETLLHQVSKEDPNAGVMLFRAEKSIEMFKAEAARPRG